MISIREEITKYKGTLEADVAMETEMQRKFIRDLKSMFNAIWRKYNTHTDKVWNKKNKKKGRKGEENIYIKEEMSARIDSI